MVPNFGTAMDRLKHDMLDLTISFDGREIFRRAVKGMCRSAHTVLEKAGISLNEIAVMIPHQANARIIDAVGHKLHIDPKKVIVNVDRFGNTSAASIPIALSEAMQAQRIQPGDAVLFTAFGAGLSRGAAVIRWGARATALAESDAALPPSAASGLELIAENVAAMQARARSRQQ